MSTTYAKLISRRREIDGINRELLALLSRRAEVVQEIASLKNELGLPTYDADRERAILLDLVACNPGPYADSAIAHLFREILALSRALMNETRRRVGGEETEARCDSPLRR